MKTTSTSQKGKNCLLPLWKSTARGTFPLNHHSCFSLTMWRTLATERKKWRNKWGLTGKLCSCRREETSYQEVTLPPTEVSSALMVVIIYEFNLPPLILSCRKKTWIKIILYLIYKYTKYYPLHITLMMLVWRKRRHQKFKGRHLPNLTLPRKIRSRQTPSNLPWRGERIMAQVGSSLSSWLERRQLVWRNWEREVIMIKK